MLRRACAKPTPGATWKPKPSGPRWRRAAIMRCSRSRSGVAPRANGIRPAMPHIVDWTSSCPSLLSPNRMLHELFRSAAVNHRSKAAVVDGVRTVTYGELQRAALDFSQTLRRCGARPGDRVAIRLPNGIDAAVALWG